MANNLLDLVNGWFAPAATPLESSDGIHKAAAVLLVELVRSDHHIDPQEMIALQQQLVDQLGLSQEEAAELIQLAEQQADISIALYPFTSTLNEHYTQEQKTALMLSLWTVAYADGRLDKYEESYLRQIADLLYIPHSKFIQTKIDYLQKLESQ
ncbi:MAG: TerB family tellurite resistance protein [Pseudomonadales bacterium]